MVKESIPCPFLLSPISYKTIPRRRWVLTLQERAKENELDESSKALVAEESATKVLKSGDVSVSSTKTNDKTSLDKVGVQDASGKVTSLGSESESEDANVTATALDESKPFRCSRCEYEWRVVEWS